MVRLVGTFSRIVKTKVLVIGDIVLDTYTIGKAQRISPEAPVAVVKVYREELRPGMAGNVALNLSALGAKVVLVGRIGDDAAGAALKRALEEENIDTSGLFIQKGLHTPVKNRIIAENQQIVRVDREDLMGLQLEMEFQLIEALPTLLEGVKVVAISDYAKGFLSPLLLQEVIKAARERHIPVIADPKGTDFAKYAGVTVIKPNLSEAIAAAALPPTASLDEVAVKVLRLSAADVLLVTRSEAGISLFYRDGRREDFAVKAREVKDVTGAGDTVLAMLTCALASNLSMAEAAQLCNVAAGIAIERFGCACVSLSDLAARLFESDTTNKIFDEKHLFALQEILTDKKITVLGIDATHELSAALFGLIRRLSQREGGALLLYLRDEEPNEHLLELLLSLREVDFIIRGCDSLRHFCQAIHPAEIYIADGEKVRSLDHGLELLHV